MRHRLLKVAEYPACNAVVTKILKILQKTPILPHNLRSFVNTLQAIYKKEFLHEQI